MIELRSVTKVHRQGPREINVLRGIDLSVGAGEFLTVMGPSGSGKSTILNLLGGLDVPTSGSILFRGRDLRQCSDRERSVVRRRFIGFVFQRFNLLPTLTAAENVALPLMLDGHGRSRALGRAHDALGRLRLSDRATHFPDALSGGEMQRVAIARALVTEPALVLCDEPTGSLDSAAGRQVLELLRALPEPDRRTVVMVTHDADAASLGDRMLTIRDGRVESESLLRGQYAVAASNA
ncbi:MAG: ABC transporter ATP-binding protein [Isosphaeraceae bacterium]|nr:ABC transporter ATP-binding protein [Isosphaeraceae bacterium]